MGNIHEKNEKPRASCGRIEGILRLHFSLYPNLTPQDAVKLLYQSEFGCGHFVPNEHTARQLLERESAALIKDAAHRRLESIGGGFIRVHIEPIADCPAALDALLCAFVRSASIRCGSEEGLLKKLEVLKASAEKGDAPFTLPALEEYLARYIEAGLPSVHHSESYRLAYHPAYRVIDARYYELVRRMGREL